MGSFVDVQQKMNIHHFEQLMTLFHNHHNEDGSSGFDIDKFRQVFGEVLGGNLTFEHMTQLFMKIDANSDGTVDWDEFSAYMMTVSIETDDPNDILDERRKKIVGVPHKDMIVKIDFVQKERKYISVSREGVVCLWSRSLKLNRVINTKEFNPRTSWVHDARFMHEHNKLIIITDDRQLCVYDLFSIKPRLVAAITQLENNPLCLAYAAGYDEDTDLILFGDDGGYVNVLSLTRRFLIDTASDNGPSEHLTPAKLTKRDSLEKNNISLYRRKIHDDWVLRVQYYPEMNAFVSCAMETAKSLVIGDLERKTLRHISIPKGIKCFEFCKRPSFLVTGGRDKIIRLWNPYVLSKPAGSLQGHNASIVSIVINHEDGHIMSLSEDKVVKMWNARNLNCLQTIIDKIPHRPENIISSIFYDVQSRQIITGSNILETWPLYTNTKQIATKSHEAPVVGAMFNSNFHQVVSGCQAGTITLWDPSCGEKIFQFHKAHGMWNFNNGQILRRLLKETVMETTDVCFVEMGLNRFIIAVGWDRTISIFTDDPTHFEARPVRILNGKGSGAHRGHEDDISAVAFCPPNVLATSSVDGTIVIWNLESGYIKLAMREPFLDLRSKEEKPVEKIVFIYNPERPNSRAARIPLLSCHADGCIRVWDTIDGVMINEFNCQVMDDEGLTTMACDNDCSILMVGGSKGHVRVIDLKALIAEMHDRQSNLVVTALWRAHMLSVSSVSYVRAYNMILTSSKDATVRIWTFDGMHIGTFGDRPWVFGDDSTYCPLPPDLKQDQDLELKKAELANKKEAMIKKNVIETWRGVFSLDAAIDPGAEIDASVGDEKDKSKNLQKLKEKAMLQFFSFDIQQRHRAPKPSVNVKYDSVYHMLHIHQMDEMQQAVVHPLRLQKPGKNGVSTVIEQLVLGATAALHDEAHGTASDAMLIDASLHQTSKIKVDASEFPFKRLGQLFSVCGLGAMFSEICVDTLHQTIGRHVAEMARDHFDVSVSSQVSEWLETRLMQVHEFEIFKSRFGSDQAGVAQVIIKDAVDSRRFDAVSMDEARRRTGLSKPQLLRAAEFWQSLNVLAVRGECLINIMGGSDLGEAVHS
nr:WD repeat-containing protein 49 [Polyrhizophydium stewartii]